MPEQPELQPKHKPPTSVRVNFSLPSFNYKPLPVPQTPGEPAPTEDHLRELMGQALSMPTPEAIFSFVDFAHRMRRMGPYNILMVYAQRPGASAVASRKEWEEAGQKVRPDAIPILILQPRGPITQVFELMDTLPALVRDPRNDAFGATGDFDPKRLKIAIDGFKPSKRMLHVDVVEEDYGSGLAGQICPTGLLQPGAERAALLGSHKTEDAVTLRGPAHWRIKLNSRMTDAEKFATLMHELGHLCCGHLGAFHGETPNVDEYGWPDRRYLSHAAREIEAELVAWHMCDREGIATGSPLYLKPHLEKAHIDGDLKYVDLDRVIRAIARVRQHIGDRKQLARLD